MFALLWIARTPVPVLLALEILSGHGSTQDSVVRIMIRKSPENNSHKNSSSSKMEYQFLSIPCPLPLWCTLYLPWFEQDLATITDQLLQIFETVHATIIKKSIKQLSLSACTDSSTFHIHWIEISNLTDKKKPTKQMSMWMHHKNTVMIIHPLSYAARRGDEREAKFRNYLFSYSTDKHPEI